MTAPFPGMDPFLESPAYWRDFHQSFIAYWRDWLLDHLPDHYDVRIDERLGVVEESPDGPKVMLPDLSVTQGHPLPWEAPNEGGVATLDREPVALQVRSLEQESDSFLRLHHRPDSSLIAVLELLSPTNKEGDGRLAYLAKRNELLRDTVHLVELDLLLGGKRLPIVGTLPPGDYFAYVARGDQRPLCEVYPWHLYEGLPRIRIPLKAPDPDLVFDLPALYAEAFRRGRYARNLPYDKPPPVALPEPRARWVADRLAAWKKAASPQ